MKKFYAFAVAALATMSMNAQLYVCGEGEGLAWEPGTPMEVTEVDGKYTFDITNFTQFKLSTTKGTWEEFNAGGLTCEYTEENLGNPVELVSGDGNISAPWDGDYHIVVVLGETPTLTLTTTTAKPEGDPDMYIRGGMNEWGVDDTWKFTNQGGGKYFFVAKGASTIEADVEFKLAGESWAKFNYGLGLVTVNTKEEQEDGDEVGAHWDFNATNSYVAENFTGTIYVTVDLKKTTDGAEVIFLKDYFETPEGVDAAIVENTEAKEYYNLQGVRVAQPTQGIYVVRQGGKVFKAIVK